MSERLAGGGEGKKTFVRVSTFSSCVTAWPSSSVGMSVEVVALVAYFLISHMLLPSALSTYSFHLFLFALFISSVYSLAFFNHASRSMLLPVRLCRFLSQFACLRSSVSWGVHHLLLCRQGFL